MRRLFFLIWIWYFSLNSWAGIAVSPIIVDLTKNHADAEIAVRNLDLKKNAYVEITPYRLLNPTDHASAKQRVNNPEQDGLLVFPAKLMLLPGQTQFVRVVKTTKRQQQDQVFEVDFIPKVSTALVHKMNADKATLGIRVVVGYGVRVILRPDEPKPSLSLKRVQDELIIKNTGNTTVTIISCSQQVSHKQTEIPLPAYTLFTSQTIRKKLDRNSQVKLEVSLMSKSFGTFYTD